MDKILIVDPLRQSSDLIRQCLASTGYEIFTAESGLNALSKVSLFLPDIVLLNAELPDISSFDVCKRIKSNPETEFTLILFMSSLDTRDSRARALQVGADDYIEKNFDSYLLISKVNSLLRVKHLSDMLKQKYVELEEKNHLLELQLKMSRQVQHALIPDIDLTFKGIRFSSQYMPAMDIGGDFYDVLQLSDSSIAVVMGDVSGHGISAALLTAMLSVMIRSLAPKYFNPDQLLFYLNNDLYKIFENSVKEMYACVFYAVIDTKEQKLYYSNAGQAIPVMVRTEADGEEAASELEAVGLPIGMMENSSYEFHQLNYEPGDLIVFHTDGLSDAFYKNNPDEFSKRFKEVLEDAKPLEDSKEIIEIILNAFYNYNATENEKYEMDDVSLIICRL
ncbi:MAG: fused response regulator/phosphatase [Clostridiales bacterium]|jgi:sigma-B regulation protein RsbU (phosphoserine phosphatase)|nr:fused response regulator/phosphatase [Clostridiales bacterium]